MLIAVFLAFALFYYWFLSPEDFADADVAAVNAPAETGLNVNAGASGFLEIPAGIFTEVVTPTWLDSTPKNNVVVNGRPAEVTVRFSAPVVAGSTMTLYLEDQPVHTLPAVIAEDSKALSIAFPAESGVGRYLMRYTACTAKDVCKDGSFGFTVR